MSKFIERLDQHQRSAIEQMRDRGLVHSRDYIVEGVYLQGSQNYNVHTATSDVDSKLVLVPTVRSLIRGTKLAFDLDIPCGDTVEKCSVKPFKDFEALFFKGNFNNLEILFTEYKLQTFSSVVPILEAKREEIVAMIWPSLVSACLGMQNQKKSGLYKCTEGTKNFFDKYGYDNKNLIHILRIAYSVSKYQTFGNFAEALLVDEEEMQKIISDIRCGVVCKDEVDGMVDGAIKSVEVVRDNLRDAGMYEQMNKQLPVFRAMLEESTSHRLEQIIK